MSTWHDPTILDQLNKISDAADTLLDTFLTLIDGFPYRDDALVNRARAFKASVDEINDSTNREAYSPRNDQASYTSPRGCEHEQ